MQRHCLYFSHLDPPANGQAVVYLTGLLEVFKSESFILATVSDNSVRYQAINVVKRSKTNINGQKSETKQKRLESEKIDAIVRLNMGPMCSHSC